MENAGPSREVRRRRHPAVRYFARWAVILVALYAGSYLVLTVQGTYAPSAYGASGPKFYEWYPRGFAFNGRVGEALCLFYAPLWALDNTVWHDGAKRRSGRHPSTDDNPWY